MSTVPSPVPEHAKPFRPWRRSGTWMVLIMFAFAFAMIGLMFLYWELHTRPFRPLQLAIGARYPNSMPRVFGGKYKSHKPGSMSTLRIVIAVDFDPTAGLPRPVGTPKDAQDRLTVDDTMTLDPRVHRAYAGLLHLAKQTTDLTPYEVINIHLEHRRPEKTSRTLFATHTQTEWFARYPEDSQAAPSAEKLIEPAESVGDETSHGQK